MKILVVDEIEREYDAKKLFVNAEVIYWEGASVNGIEDVDGDLIPCRDAEMWCPIIDVDTGIILNWEAGKTADIYYKVCDMCRYNLFDADGNEIKSQDYDYVPDCLAPGGDGCGDYISMTVDENGKIENWKFSVNML